MDLNIVIAVSVTSLISVILFRVRPEYILGLHIFGRVVLDSVYAISYGEAIAGITIMQLYSVAWSAFFIAYILYFNRWRVAFPRITLPVTLLIMSAALSAAINLNVFYFAESSLKWFYFFSVVFFCVNTLNTCRPERLFLIVLLCGSYLFANQIMFGLTSGPKVSHGLTNYIGSYYHEAGFSSMVLLLTSATIGLYVFAQKKATKSFLLVFLSMELASLLLAGYRTAVLAGVVLVVAFLFFQSLRKASLFIAFSLIGLIGLIGILWVGISGHLALFEDIGKLVSNPGAYFDFSGGGGDKEILTGRVYLINTIMHYYLNADISQQIGGMGAGVAQQRIGAYAHNEFISALAEFGLIGLLVFVFFHLQMLRNCLIARKENLVLGNLTISVVLSVVVLSLATMPYHDMRALLFLAVMYSFADYMSKLHLGTMGGADSLRNQRSKHIMASRSYARF